jgi:hypothetical protein
MNEVATLADQMNPAARIAGGGLELPAVARYCICDLAIESTVPFPELTQTQESSDVCFSVLPAGLGFPGDVAWFQHLDSGPENETWLEIGDCAGDYLIRFQDYGDFLISRDGRSVQCCPLPGTAESTVRHLFLDQIVPLVLSRRGTLVLHASAVLTPGGVVAFVGKSGQGKSTLAACFGQNGFRLISDDYLLLRRTELRKTTALAPAEDWVAIPSYPGVRLWPESSDGIFSVPPESAEIAEYTDKRRVSDPALIPFAEGPSSLRCLYFLEDAEEDAFLPKPATIRLSPRDAFMKLVTCAFNLDIRDKALLERQFDAIGEISTQLPCFQLDYARDFAALPAVRQLIVDQPVRSQS